MKISEEELIERRNTIITTAFQLFCEKGIEKVTLACIAKKSGVGESSVYRYFTNKPLLVLATLNILWLNIENHLENTMNQAPNYHSMTGLQQVGVSLEAFRLLYMNNSDFILFSYEAKLYLQRNGISLTKREYDELMDVLRIPCIASLEKGQKDGSILSNVNKEDLFYAIWGCVRGYIVKIVIYESLCSEENPWTSRYDILKSGILTALATGWTDLSALHQSDI